VLLLFTAVVDQSGKIASPGLNLSGGKPCPALVAEGSLGSMALDLRGREGRFLGMRRRISVLAERDFRRFFLGYAASMLGTSMASVATAFAVLQSGGGGAELGDVLAARILPLVLMLLVGGVVADRLGSRAVMLAADLTRCTAQAAFAVLLLTGRSPLWAMVLLAAVAGVGEAAFSPSLSALIPQLAPGSALAPANALLGFARSGASVAGPALAGILTAALGPAIVLAVDSASYAVSVAALWRLPGALPVPTARRSFLSDLGQGWSTFRSRTWLWVTSLHLCLFNLFVWGPFLVLGPVVAGQRLGGAGAWGAVMALYGTGAALGGLGLLLLHRSPRRPLLVAVVASLGWALPSAALTECLPTGWVCCATLLAGVGSSVCGSLYSTVTQTQVPPEQRARISAYSSFGAFALGPVGLAAAGPVSVAVGVTPVLAFGALWQTLAVAVVVALPAVRRRQLTYRQDGVGPCTSRT
jgi:MFS family permease